MHPPTEITLLSELKKKCKSWIHIQKTLPRAALNLFWQQMSRAEGCPQEVSSLHPLALQTVYERHRATAQQPGH